MQNFIEDFLGYLEVEKDCSKNTLVKYCSDLKYLKYYLENYFSINSPDDVTTANLHKYIEYIKEKNNLKAVSVANKIAVIKSFFKYLYYHDLVAKNPAELLKMPRRQKRLPKFLNEIETAKLLSAPDRITCSRVSKFKIRDKLILTLFIYTGIRKSELLGLNWQDIDLGSNYLIVRKSKNKTDRVIPLHDKVSKLLDLYLSIRLPLTDNALIIGEQGKRLTKASLNNLFKRCINLSGLTGKGYTIHSLRHTFATRLLARDVNLVKIKNLLGHRSIESTEIYLHTTSKELADSINLL